MPNVVAGEVIHAIVGDEGQTLGKHVVKIFHLTRDEIHVHGLVKGIVAVHPVVFDPMLAEEGSDLGLGIKVPYVAEVVGLGLRNVVSVPHTGLLVDPAVGHPALRVSGLVETIFDQTSAELLPDLINIVISLRKHFLLKQEVGPGFKLKLGVGPGISEGHSGQVDGSVVFSEQVRGDGG